MKPVLFWNIKQANDETQRRSFMTSSYIPSTILKGTLNFLQFCINQMCVFAPLLKLSILLGANKKYQGPTEKFWSSLWGWTIQEYFEFCHINLAHYIRQLFCLSESLCTFVCMWYYMPVGTSLLSSGIFACNNKLGKTQKIMKDGNCGY